MLTATFMNSVKETPRVNLYRFAIEDPNFNFVPGQFVRVSIDDLRTEKGFLVWRSYSIASSPYDKGVIELCIAKVENGLFTSRLERINKREKINIDGPYGLFVLKKPLTGITTFTAGGSGIAPIRSMIRTLFFDNFEGPVELYFGIRNSDEFIYRKEFEELASKHSNFKFFVSTEEQNLQKLKSEKGYISDILAKHMDKNQDHQFYMCGPPLMVSATIKKLLEMGFEKERFHKEQWG